MINWYDNLKNLLNKKSSFDLNDMEYGESYFNEYLEDSYEDNVETYREDEVFGLLNDPFQDFLTEHNYDDGSDSYKIASVNQLKGFTRVANTNTLIRKSQKDFWEIKAGQDGELVIERLFDEEGNPINM